MILGVLPSITATAEFVVPEVSMLVTYPFYWGLQCKTYQGQYR